MADGDESQKLSLPFGDVIKRLAVAIHSQLQNILHNMRIQSPELRTQSLLAFISRSKRKLAQLLAITRWLDMPGVAQFFTNMSQLQLKISSRENRLNENQDALYFTHSQLFSRRIRTLDVVSAKDILARGTYPHLPASIFSSEMPMEDVLESNDAAETALRKSLDIYLRSKLALGDAVPSDIDFSSIDKGVLKLRVTNMYELLLTLDHLDTSSPWNVLRLKLCVVSHPQESFHSVQNLSGVENDILLVLRRIAEGPVLLNNPAATASSSSSSSSSATASSSSESGLIENNETIGINPNDSIGTEGYNSTIINTHNRALLPRFHTICQHTAYATALRYLYVQALETSRTIWSGLCQADFQEKRFYSQFVFRFWRSRNTGYYQYELRVIQLRSPTQTYVPLDEEIVYVDSDGEEVGGDVGLTADIRETNKEKTANSNLNQSSDTSSSAENSFKPANLILELWTCSAPDDSEGSLRITRRRVLGKIIPPNTSELPLRNNLKNQNQKDLGPVGLFDVTEFITNGVTFCSMFHKVLELCATNRLWVLHSRIMKSPGVSHALSSGQVSSVIFQAFSFSFFSYFLTFCFVCFLHFYRFFLSFRL
jgi:Mediator complex subunit MED14